MGGFFVVTLNIWFPFVQKIFTFSFFWVSNYLNSTAPSGSRFQQEQPWVRLTLTLPWTRLQWPFLVLLPRVGSNPFWTKPEVVLLGPASLYASGDADARRHFPGATHHPGCEQRPRVLDPRKQSPRCQKLTAKRGRVRSITKQRSSDCCSSK